MISKCYIYDMDYFRRERGMRNCSVFQILTWVTSFPFQLLRNLTETPAVGILLLLVRLSLSIAVYLLWFVCGWQYESLGESSDSLSNTNWQLTRHPQPQAAEKAPSLQGNDSWFSVRTLVWAFEHIIPRLPRLPSDVQPSPLRAGSRCWTRFLICIARSWFPFHKLLCSRRRWRHRINIRFPQVVPSATRTPPPPRNPINFYEL